MIICFVRSDACILWSLTHIKLLPVSSLFCTGGTEREKKILGQKKKVNMGNKADISQLHAVSSSAISMLITEKSLSDLCALCSCLSPFCLSLCPTQERSTLHCTGHMFTWKKRTLEQWTEANAHNITQLMCRGFQRNAVPLVCYHLSSQSDMLIRSMSALESPSSPRRFNHSLEADGVRGGSAHAFHAVSGQRVGNGRRVGVMSAYLFTLLAASMLLL